MRSYPSWIAGLRYRGPDGTNRGRYCRRLGAGDPLALIPEPENTYDQNAVAVKHEGHHLGYIPARHHWVAAAIEEDRKLSCVVTRIEEEGWFFRRASFVGVQISVNDAKDIANTPEAAALTARVAEQSRREKRARELCIDGLRVLAYMAMADDEVTAAEVNIEVSYIEARLASDRMEHDAALTDAMLALSQGLVVKTRGLSRAINIVAADREHFKLLLDAVLQIANLGGDPKGTQIIALERLSKAGKVKGWI